MPSPPATTWRLLVVEDDEDFAADLRLVLGPEAGTLTVVRTIREALDVPGPFDAACVDLGLPDGDGADLVRSLMNRDPSLPVIILTVHRSDARILAAFRAGARGYLLKEHAGDRLFAAVEEAIDGGAPMSPAVARRLLSLVAGLPDVAPRPPSPEPALTAREREVLRAFAEGMTYAQAAAQLDMSVNTLRTHVRHVYEKLCVGSRTQAVMNALQLGLLSDR